MPHLDEPKKRKKKKEEAKKLAIIHRGDAFESQGLGKFAKDVVRVGEWKHPVTGQEVKFDRARLEKLSENTKRYLENGNKIPYPDGHSFKVKDNMGFWPGPFMVHGEALFAVVEPTDEEAKKMMLDGSLDAVSVLIDFDVTDPKGHKYEEVITHVCGTNYPVITEQGPFLKLSQEMQEESQVNLYFPADDVADQEDNGVQLALDRFAEALQVTGGTFDDCVRTIMRRQGVSQESAQAICAKIKRDAGELSRVDRLAEAFTALSRGTR